MEKEKVSSEKKPFFESKKGIIFAGAAVGIISLILVQLGNPKNISAPIITAIPRKNLVTGEEPPFD